MAFNDAATFTEWSQSKLVSAHHGLGACSTTGGSDCAS